MAPSNYAWHAAPDGGSCFPTADGGWVYVSNSEVALGGGGVGVLRFNSSGTTVDAYRILSGTHRNCAGGTTPWGTWLSCEENGSVGKVYECNPLAAGEGVQRPALGSFNHEAAGVDPDTGIVYLTEDDPTGRLYRFVPTTPGDLSSRQPVRRQRLRHHRHLGAHRHHRPRPSGDHHGVQRRRGHLGPRRAAVLHHQGRRPGVGAGARDADAHRALRRQHHRRCAAHRRRQHHRAPALRRPLRRRGRREHGDLPDRTQQRRPRGHTVPARQRAVDLRAHRSGVQPRRHPALLQLAARHRRRHRHHLRDHRTVPHVGVERRAVRGVHRDARRTERGVRRLRLHRPRRHDHQLPMGLRRRHHRHGHHHRPHLPRSRHLHGIAHRHRRRRRHRPPPPPRSPSSPARSHPSPTPPTRTPAPSPTAGERRTRAAPGPSRPPPRSP